MALGIYSAADPDTAFSTDESFDNPLTVVADGTVGGTSEAKFYIRNDDSTLKYSDIEIAPIDGGDLLIDGSKGFFWKLIQGDVRPVKEQWDLVSPGNTMSIEDEIEDTNTYLPFWIQVATPSGAAAVSYQSVRLRITATETII